LGSSHAHNGHAGEPIAIENSVQKFRPGGAEPISRRNNGVNVNSKYTPIQNASSMKRFTLLLSSAGLCRTTATQSNLLSSISPNFSYMPAKCLILL
jgi:hypothetical protein